MEKDFYTLLGVSPSAPEREIKRAYHDLARTMHPDKAPTPEEARRLEEVFAAVTKAYNTLKDPEKRKEYDTRRGGQGPPSATATQSGTHPAVSERTNGPASNSPAGAMSQGSGAGGSGSGSSRPSSAATHKSLEASRQGIAEKAFHRGLHMVQGGDHTRAVEFFESAVKNNPDEPRYHAQLAKSLMQARRGFTRAVEVATRACDLDPYNMDYKIILADIYERAGSKSLAIKTFENVLKWDVENALAKRKLKELQGGGRSESFFVNLWNSLRSKK